MQESGLVASYVLDGQGGGERVGWSEVCDWNKDKGLLWVHLNRESEDSQHWLHNDSGLDPMVVESLLATDTRPRCAPMAGGYLLFLRGINMNPGADPEDMVSIRLWLEQDRIISLRQRRLLSVDEMRQALERGEGPADVGEFVAQLAERMTERMAHVIEDIDDEVDRIEGLVLEGGERGLRQQVNELRRTIIALKRYLSPQRDALNHLAIIKTPWMTERDSLQLREESNRVTRYVENLDAARERAAVTHEELASRVSEEVNSRMYVLSIVAAIFLPLGFLTGLFGINVGGIPLAESPRGFLEIVGLLTLITGLQVALFRWRRWL